MLPRHLHNVGSRYLACTGHTRLPYEIRDLPRCPRSAAYYPQTFFQPVSTWHPWEHVRPGPHPGHPHTFGRPWFPPHSSWFHSPLCNMSSAEDEPTRKRKSLEGDASRRKMWSKRSYPPANDFSVPPAQEYSGLSAGLQPEVKAAEPHRKWEDLSDPHCTPSSGRGKFDFSVLSYNILSQDLLESNTNLYHHCRRAYLFWNFRMPNILRELEEMNADILCLQEVQEDHYRDQIKPRLEALGYLCEYKSRTGSKTDGCAICFKSDKFSLASVKPVEYFRKDIPLLDRDNVGLLLMLRPKTGGEAPTLCVANTHLLFNPRRGDIKLTQLAILLAEITEVAQMQDGKFCPIILCGDFNAVPDSPLLRFIKEGRLNYEGMPTGKVSGQEPYPRGQRVLSFPLWPKSLGITRECVYEDRKDREQREDNVKEGAIKDREEQRVESRDKEESKLRHHFSLSSVYSHVFPDTGAPEITTCHSRSAVTVDYIFYSAATEDSSAQPGASTPSHGLKLLGRLSLLNEKELWSLSGLPNETNSSDHLSLLARFRLEV